jgi:hypothetical protein
MSPLKVSNYVIKDMNRSEAKEISMNSKEKY